MKIKPILIGLLGLSCLAGGLYLTFVQLPPSGSSPAGADGETTETIAQAPREQAEGASAPKAPLEAKSETKPETTSSPPDGSAAPPTPPAQAAAKPNAPVVKPRLLNELLTPADSLSPTPPAEAPPPPDLLGADGKPVASGAVPPPPWSVEIGLYATRSTAEAVIARWRLDYPTLTVATWADQQGQLWYSASIPDLAPRQAQDLARTLRTQGLSPVGAIPPSAAPTGGSPAAPPAPSPTSSPSPTSTPSLGQTGASPS